MAKKGTLTDGHFKAGEPLFEFYEKLHFNEMDAREKLNSKFQIFVTAAVGILGYLFTLLNQTKPLPLNSLPLFALVGILAFVFMLISGYYFIRSYWGNKYAFFATAKEMDEHRKQLIEYDKQHKQQISEGQFHNDILATLVRISTKNAKMNERRSDWIHSGNYFLIVAIVLTLLASIAFWFSDSKGKSDDVKVRIIEPVKIESARSHVAEAAQAPTAAAPSTGANDKTRNTKKTAKRKRQEIGRK